jgi:hypothetical protein
MTLPGLIVDPPDVINAVIINTFWALYNGIAIVMGILVCIERPRRRSTDRLTVSEPISIADAEGASCKIVDISETGIKVECDDALDLDAEKVITSVSIASKNLDELKGDVVWAKKEGRRVSYGIRLKIGTNENYRRIVNYIYERNKGYHQNKSK